MKYACAYDSEQTIIGLIHHITVRPFTISYNRINGKRLSSHGPSLTVQIVEVTNFYKDDPSVQRKIQATQTDFILPWRKAIPKILQFVTEHGGTLFSHAWHRDLEFLHRTQEWIGGKNNRIFHKSLVQWPDSGCYDKNWSNIARVCSLHFLMNRCPKFMKAYTEWYSGLPEAKFKVHMDLEHLMQFVLGDPSYRESHTSTGDCHDLVRILIRAFDYDKYKLDGKSYIISEKTMEPTLSHTQAQKVSSLVRLPH